MTKRLKNAGLALVLVAGVLLLQGCGGSMPLSPEVKNGSVSFDMTGLTDDFAVVNVDSTLGSEVQQRNEKTTRKNIADNKFKTADIFVDAMKKALTDAGLFSKVVDKDGDRVFVISEIRNRITPIQGDFRTVYHETHFKIALNDKQGKKLWGTSIWIDDTDKPKTMDITQVATSQTGLSMFLASASSLAAKDLVKELQSSLAAGAKAAGK